MKVCKFGGTSMADANAIMRVVDIIKSDSCRRYIVVSAPGKRFAGDEKVTDLLYRLKRECSCGKGFESVFETLKNRFCEIETDLEVNADMSRQFDEIKVAIQGGEETDYVASRGEYLSAQLLAKKLQIPFVDTKDLIKFFGNKLDFEITIDNLRQALKEMDYAVLPGFYGSDENGRVKTFSRGGSDITGALVAAAVSADEYENWTDVDGIFDRDPRKFSDAKLTTRLTYAEMYKLSNSGANVLHKDAVFPVEQAGIPIHILNTFNVESLGSVIE